MNSYDSAHERKYGTRQPDVQLLNPYAFLGLPEHAAAPNDDSVPAIAAMKNGDTCQRFPAASSSRSVPAIGVPDNPILSLRSTSSLACNAIRHAV